MKIRWVNRYDPTNRMLRVAAILWGTKRGDPGYKRRLSLALRPSLLSVHREADAWFATIAGVRVHFKWDSRGVLT